MIQLYCLCVCVLLWYPCMQKKSPPSYSTIPTNQRKCVVPSLFLLSPFLNARRRRLLASEKSPLARVKKRALAMRDYVAPNLLQLLQSGVYNRPLEQIARSQGARNLFQVSATPEYLVSYLVNCGQFLANRSQFWCDYNEDQNTRSYLNTGYECYIL